MGVTIYDIAKSVNLSAATVSRVLNKRTDARIPEVTRLRVIEAAREMGYRPNLVARALTTGRTFNIGVFACSMQEMTGPHFARMLEVVEPKAHSLGYRVVVSSELESLVEGRQVDGIILLSAPSDPRFGSMLRGKTCVFVRNLIRDFPNCISWNDIEGMQKAVGYLLGLGHKKIVGLFGDIVPEPHTQYPKVIGFRQAIEEAGEELLECWGTRSPDQFENGYRLMKDLLDGTDDITAVVARNDYLAIGAIRAIRDAGLSVPDDVSVIGYNDTILTQCSYPLLTSVHTPIAEAGEIAVDRLATAISHGVEEFAGVVLQTSLTIRDSSAPPRKRF